MSDKQISIQIKPVRHATDPNDYLLYKAALEWDLIDPIIIEKRDDLKSTAFWQDKVEPFNHQVSNLINFCRRLPVTLLADDVGLGKTISAGLVASELISRGRLSKILIVCPKILGPQWKEELETKFGITSIIATGKDLKRAEPPDEIGAVITTYNSARMHLDALEHSGYDMLILDEAHKLRNLHGTEAPPQVAIKFKEALSKRWFKYVLLLTATPIQNRLWDLYSLVELLTVARGHENPFGNPGMFARKFIADNKADARKLRPEAQEEFRGIIYRYMSRVRRGDADLHFPQREVHLHSVDPSEEELEIVKIVARSIEGLDRLTQIGILKTLVSSPEALVLLLRRMSEKGTIKKPFYEEVNEVVKRISITAKLQGLESLIDKLRAEKPDDWRVVIFTTRLETQTSIQNFLEDKGIKCGLINGTTASVNVDTLEKFRADKPKINVIISTEAGSEGVNMQIANVLVNYDLPWNPMVVEQRIGRIQRLGSPHEKVIIFNIVLENTFEEYVVGRLMEKLQLASSAIGDIESLLEASGISEGEDSGGAFEDKILKLVLDSLQGKDVKKAADRTAASIEKAKIQLKNEESNINSLLGKMNDEEGPRCPSLPQTIQSMEAKELVIEGLKSLGATVTEKTPSLYSSLLNGKLEMIRFDNNLSLPVADGSLFKNVLYAPGSPAFEKLVVALTNTGLHRVEDADTDVEDQADKEVKKWLKEFKGEYEDLKVGKVRRTFSGSALVRARITVAHDSYERLVEVMCSNSDHVGSAGVEALDPLQDSFITDVKTIGVSEELLSEEVMSDEGVSEFCRFYSERLVHELKNTGDNNFKKKKIENDFTPRVELTLVGLEGYVRRQVIVEVSYSLNSNNIYKSKLTLIPSSGEITSQPEMSVCEETKISLPTDCLAVCDLSGLLVNRDLLIRSEVSDRSALKRFIYPCDLTGKKVLQDELVKSDTTGKFILATLIRTSALSNKKAEPDSFDFCAFSGTEVLKEELAVSEISNKKYRIDDQSKSSVSGKLGHKSEFIKCALTDELIAPDESETCEITGKVVKKGSLKECSVSGKKVLENQLTKSDVTGKLLLTSLIVISPISGKKAEPEMFDNCEFTNTVVLKNEMAVSKVSGKKYRVDEELKSSVSGKTGHKSEFIICAITDKPILPKESEKCEVSDSVVTKGLLEECSVSNQKVMPSLLEKSSLSGKKALKKFFESSSLSEAKFIESEGIKSSTGKYCLPVEAQSCTWDSTPYHPDDIIICRLSNLPYHFKYTVSDSVGSKFKILGDLLDGTLRSHEVIENIQLVTENIISTLKNKKIEPEYFKMSPDQTRLAISVRVKTMLGFKTQFFGIIFSLSDNAVLGRISKGSRIESTWTEDNK